MSDRLLYNTNQYPWDHVDNLDAALFTGDHFYEINELITLQFMLARWQKQVAEIMEFVNESEEGENEKPDCEICNDTGYAKQAGLCPNCVVV